MSHVQIREANEADIPAICRLQQQWLGEDCVYGFVPASSEQVKSSLGPYFLVAEIQDNIVGFISGSVRLSDGLAVIPKGEAYIEIDDVYVSSQFRQSGIGGKLIENFLAKAKARDITYALLYSATKDIHSVLRFYEHHGFRSWFIQMFREL